jgi:hypothetical protein
MNSKIHSFKQSERVLQFSLFSLLFLFFGFTNSINARPGDLDSGFGSEQFGANGDKPIPSAFNQ